jgi:hypothetical protein
MRKRLVTGKRRNVAPSGLDSSHPFLYNSVLTESILSNAGSLDWKGNRYVSRS